MLFVRKTKKMVDRILNMTFNDICFDNRTVMYKYKYYNAKKKNWNDSNINLLNLHTHMNTLLSQVEKSK